MSTRKESKRARFYAQQRKARICDRIIKANRDKPGFVGVSMGVRIGSSVYGPGAMFLTNYQPS